MAQFLVLVVSQPEPFPGQSQVQVPLVTAVAPKRVPFRRSLGMAEELDFHLFELAGAEGEVARRNFIAKALTDLSDTEWNLDPARIEHVLIVDEYALGRFGPQERGILLASERADD